MHSSERRKCDPNSINNADAYQLTLAEKRLNVFATTQIKMIIKIQTTMHLIYARVLSLEVW